MSLSGRGSGVVGLSCIVPQLVLFVEPREQFVLVWVVGPFLAVESHIVNAKHFRICLRHLERI